MTRATQIRSPFGAWFEGTWRRKAESQADAAQRLRSVTKISVMTILRACAGKPVRSATALKLRELTGKRVKLESLLIGAEAA